MNNMFLSISLKFLSPIIFVSSIYVLLKGHNEPGGGFIGGLLAALSWTLVKIGSNRNSEKEAQKTNFYIMGIGLGFAMLSGLYAILFDEVAFTAHWGPGITIPMLGLVKFSSVLVFDFGVYIVILFASIKMLRSFME